MPTPETQTALPNSHNVTRITLENGIVLLVYENHNVQSVVVSGSLEAGSIFEAPQQGGLAALVASALMRGTQTYDFDAIHSGLEDIGAELSFNGGKFKVGFGGKALAEDLNVLLATLADALRHPTFPSEQIERLRGERLTWLQYQQQDTRWQAGRVFRQTLYPNHHPFHYSSRGTLETLPTLSAEDLRTYHARQYGPQGMIITVVGAIHTQTVLDMVNDYLGDWCNDAQLATPELPALTPATETQRLGTIVPGKTQSDIALGVLGPSRLAPDYRAGVLANSILGQFGMMGRIGDVVREREGMAYYAYSSLEGGYGPGAWHVAAGVSPENVDRAVDLIREELRRITTEPVSQADLEDNQSYFTGRLPLQLETSEGLASTLHTIESYDLGLDYLLHYRDEIYAQTVDDLLAATQHYLNPDALVISVAGPDID